MTGRFCRSEYNGWMAENGTDDLVNYGMALMQNPCLVWMDTQRFQLQIFTKKSTKILI